MNRSGKCACSRAAEWLEAEGIDPVAFFADPVPTPAIRRLTARLLAEASQLYAHAGDGVAALPLSCRPGIEAARRIYAAIGHDLAAHGHDSITRRAHTTKGRKLALLMQSGLSVAAMSVMPRAATLHAAPRPEVAFLVEAAANPRAAVGRSEAVLEVLAQLEAQDRDRRNRRTGGTATA